MGLDYLKKINGDPAWDAVEGEAAFTSLGAASQKALADNLAGITPSYSVSVNGRIYNWSGNGYRSQRYSGLIPSTAFAYDDFFYYHSPLGGSKYPYTWGLGVKNKTTGTSFKIAIPNGDSATLKYTYAIAPSLTDNGSTLTWLPLTFNGGATTVTRTSDTTDIISDVIETGARIPFLFVRAFGTGAGAAYIAPDQYGELRASMFGDDGIVRSQTVMDQTNGATYPIVMSAGGTCNYNVRGVYWGGTKQTTISLGALGDSLDQGWNTQQIWAQWPFGGPARWAIKYMRDVFGGDMATYPNASAGELHSVSMGRISEYAAGQVSVVTLRPWSPNSYDAGVSFEAQWQEFLTGMAAIQSYGAVPLPMTITPCGASGAKLRGIQMLNSRVRALPLFVDLDAAVRDPANPTRILPAYMDPLGNTTHFSTAGNAAQGLEIASTLAGLF